MAKILRKKSGLIIGVLILMLPFSLPGQRPLQAGGLLAQERYLTGIEVKDEREKAMVLLTSCGKLECRAFLLKDPARLALYLPNTILTWEAKEISYEKGLVKKVEASQYSEKPPIVRVTLYLTYPTSYTIEASERLFTMKLDKKGEYTPRKQRKEAKKHFKEGKRHYKREEFPEALLEFGKALDFDPSLRKAENYIFRAKEGMKERERLEEKIPTKIKKERVEGESKRQEKERRKAIKRHYILGEAYYWEGKLKEAISQWNRVLDLDPGHKRALRYKRKAEKELKEALRERKEEEREKKIAHYYEKGKIYYREGEFSLALGSFERVLDFDPENREAIKYQEKCKRELAQIKEAKKREEILPPEIPRRLEKEEELELIPRFERVKGQLKRVEVKDLPTQIQVIITTQEGMNYTFFELGDPPRLVIDIPDAILEWQVRETKVEEGVVQGVRCGQFQEEPAIARVVIDLKRLGVKYQILKEDNQIIASISKPVGLEKVVIPVRPERKKEVFILGEVNSPGVYNLPEKGIGILEAIIGLAGSSTERAVLEAVVLLRGELPHPQLITIDMEKIICEEKLEENILLQPGDIVYISGRLGMTLSEILEEIMPSLEAVKWIEAPPQRDLCPGGE